MEMKEFNSTENGEFKKRDKNSAFVDAKRKRAYSETSAEGKSLDNVEKEIAKSKRFRISAKQKSSQKLKKSDKMNIDSTNFKERKRNMSAPSNKSAGLKNEDKNLDTSIERRRKKCISLSEDPVQNNSAKIENKKLLSVDVKTPTTKIVSAAYNSPMKPKFKKNFRRRSLRIVIDEPPLFSQPDVLVRVRSHYTASKKKEFFDDITSRSSTQSKKSGGKKGNDNKVNDEDSKQGKKNTNHESEAGKNQEQSGIDNLSKFDQPVPEKVPCVEPKIKSQEIVQKGSMKLNEEVKVETKVQLYDEESEDDPLKWCICRQPHNYRPIGWILFTIPIGATNDELITFINEFHFQTSYVIRRQNEIFVPIGSAFEASSRITIILGNVFFKGVPVQAKILSRTEGDEAINGD